MYLAIRIGENPVRQASKGEKMDIGLIVFLAVIGLGVFLRWLPAVDKPYRGFRHKRVEIDYSLLRIGKDGEIICLSE